jgi:hypothetical protein
MGLLKKAQLNTPPPPKSEGSTRPRRSFLDKAVSFRDAEDIEELCIDRLRKIAAGPEIAYAALTVLKAYYPSIAEIVYQKAGNAFRVQSTVGISGNSCVDGVKLPSLERPLPHEGYYSFSASELGLTCLPYGAKAFAFPVSPKGQDGYLVFITDGNDSPPVSSLLRIVNTFPMKFISAAQMKPSGQPEPKAATGSKAMDAVNAFGSAHIAVLRLNTEKAPSNGSLAEQACVRLGAFGKAFPEGTDKIVVLLKPALDRELYIHQLLKSLRNAASLGAADLVVESEDFASDQETALAIINRK